MIQHGIRCAGYGQSPKPASPAPYKLHAIVQQLVELLQSLNIHTAIHVVGHDWGAATAWRLALVHPQRVRSLTALSVGHPAGGAAAGGMPQRAKWWYMLFFCQAVRVRLHSETAATTCIMQEAEQLLAANDWTLLRAMLREADHAQQQRYVDRLSQPGALTGALDWYRANVRAGMLGQTQLRAGGVLDCPVMGVWGDQGVSLLESIGFDHRAPQTAR